LDTTTFDSLTTIHGHGVTSGTNGVIGFNDTQETNVKASTATRTLVARPVAVPRRSEAYGPEADLDADIAWLESL
jgi:hypothetical protein